MDLIKFLVVGPIRSGTTMLETALDEHPEIFCAGELLHGDVKWRQRASLMAFGHGRYCPLGKERDFLRKFWTTLQPPAAPASAKALGFKILYHQLDELKLWSELPKIPDFHLFCTRRNPVTCVVSRIQAHQSGYWHKDLEGRVWNHPQVVDPAPPPPVWLDPVEGAMQVLNIIKGQQMARVMFKMLPFAHCTVVDYEATQKPDVIHQFIQFLGLSPGPGTLPRTGRLVDQTLRERLENFDELMKSWPPELCKHLEAE